MPNKLLSLFRGPQTMRFRTPSVLRFAAHAPLALLLFCVVIPLSHAVDCDPQLTPTPDSIGYVVRNDRCEGLYVSPVAAHGGLELISLTRGRLQFALEPGRRLAVRVANQGMTLSPVHVRAVATPLRTYYRMDTLLSPGQAWQWPVDDVLLPLHLTANRLGIFAWTTMDAGKVFVPVKINEPGTDTLYLLVRPNVSVQNVMWRASQLIDGQRTATGWQNVAEQALAGEAIPIVLPAGATGLLEVEVAAIVENGSWAKLRLKVWRE